MNAAGFSIFIYINFIIYNTFLSQYHETNVKEIFDFVKEKIENDFSGITNFFSIGKWKNFVKKIFY